MGESSGHPARAPPPTAALLVLEGPLGHIWLRGDISGQLHGRQPWLQVVPEPLLGHSWVAQLLGHLADCPCPVPSCRYTRTTCTPRTANSTPLRRCFMRWGLSTPATWSLLPSIPLPRATWASMWAPASLPLLLGLPGPTASP